MQNPNDKPTAPAPTATATRSDRTSWSGVMSDPARFIVNHWLGVVVFTVGITFFSAITQTGKPVWWTCVGTMILIDLAIFVSFWKFNQWFEARATPPAPVPAVPAPTAPATIGRANPGRTFVVVAGQVGQWHEGQTFTEYDFRRLHPPPPHGSADDYYEELYARLLAMQPPRIRVVG